MWQAIKGDDRKGTASWKIELNTQFFRTPYWVNPGRATASQKRAAGEPTTKPAGGKTCQGSGGCKRFKWWMKFNWSICIIIVESMHRYWLIEHFITRINSWGLHWRGALLPCNAGPFGPCPLFLLSLTFLRPSYFRVYLLLAKVEWVYTTYALCMFLHVCV